MDSSHYRKIDLQSSADFTYLHGNAVALSRQKLDLHLPPSANPDDGPDPMRERVRELVDDVCSRDSLTKPRILHVQLVSNNLVVHKPHLLLRLRLHRHQRSRFFISRVPFPPGAYRPGGNR
jgi:hypothetical protein